VHSTAPDALRQHIGAAQIPHCYGGEGQGFEAACKLGCDGDADADGK